MGISQAFKEYEDAVAEFEVTMNRDQREAPILLRAADEAKRAWEDAKEDLNTFKEDMRTNVPQPGPEVAEKESRSGLRTWGVKYTNEYKAQSRGLDKKLLRLRSGIEEDRRDHEHCSGPGGGPNREKRPYRPHRALMLDKDVVTLKYSMSLEDVERIITRHLTPWLESGLGINVKYPLLKTLEQYLMTFMDKLVERRYKAAKDMMEEGELRNMKSIEDIFGLLKSSIRDRIPLFQ